VTLNGLLKCPHGPWNTDLTLRNERTARLTVDPGDREIVRRLKIAAGENDLSAKDIVREAILFWLEHQDLVEDILAPEKAQKVSDESSGERTVHDTVRAVLGQDRVLVQVMRYTCHADSFWAARNWAGVW
jgi:hypothetical protein